MPEFWKIIVILTAKNDSVRLHFEIKFYFVSKATILWLKVMQWV